MTDQQQNPVGELFSSGWAVVVKQTAAGDTGSSTAYYVRVPDRHGAEDALRQILGAGPAAVIEARLPVQSSVFDAINVPTGGAASCRPGNQGSNRQ